jgi:hypothetical protein
MAAWMRRATRLFVITSLALLLWPLMGARVQARREGTFAYPYVRVWTAVVRLMRVDFECTITEKDKDDGYFLFEYPDRGKRYPGSVELVATRADESGGVRVVIQIPGMPTYVESMMMDRLAKKLEQEYGPAKEPKPAEPQDPNKDEGERPAPGDKAKPDNPPKPKSSVSP